MYNATIRIRKEYMSFNSDDGQKVEMQGIRIILGAKVEKFIALENLVSGRNSNFELLGYTNPDLAQWYANVPVGTEMELREIEPSKSLKDVYDDDEEEEAPKSRKLFIH